MPSPPDPILTHSCREALVALSIWLAALIYTVGYSVLFGYGGAERELHFVFGLPSWVVWGIVLPWTLCVAAAGWFAFGFMTDDTLE